MTEKKLQSLFVQFLNDNWIYHIKTIVCSRAGVPDIIACIGGKFVAFELKGTDGRASELQKWNGEKIKLSGGKFYIVTPDNYREVIDTALHTQRTGAR